MIKRLLAALLLALASCAPAYAADNYTLLAAQTTTTAACSATRAVNAKSWGSPRAFMSAGTTSAGAGAATIIIYGSALGTTEWVSLGTMTLTLATTITFDTGTTGFATLAPWPYLCAHVSAISGTGASVNVYAGSQ